MKEKKKKINLQKSSLLRLQDEQMKALIGADDTQTNDSGVACDNTVTLQAVAQAVEGSCCRRSCNKS